MKSLKKLLSSFKHSFTYLLPLTASLNIGVVMLLSLSVHFLNQGLTEISEYSIFLIRFFLIASFSTLIITLVLTSLRVILKWLKFTQNAQDFLLAPIFTLNIFLILLHCGMYIHYGEGINPQITHLLGPNQSAILGFLQEQYNIYLWGLLITATSFSLPFLYSIFLSKHLKQFSLKFYNTILATILPLAIIGAILIHSNNYQGRYNLKRLSNDPLASTWHTFLVTTNIDGKHINRIMSPYLINRETPNLNLARKWCNVKHDSSSPSSAFTRTTDSNQKPFSLLCRPSHIFYIQMESQDSIVIRNKTYHPLSKELLSLAKTGIYVPNFFGSGPGTNSSSYAALASFPGLKLVPHPKKYKNKGHQSALRFLTNKLGYTTSVESASYHQAMLKNDYLTVAGVNNITTYSEKHPKKEWDNTWGITDKQFVSDILANTSFPDSHFAMFMTVSNHPPFSVKATKEGFDESQIPDHEYAIFKHTESSGKKRAGIYWFADREMGRLVQGLYQKYPKALFIITADHWSGHTKDDRDKLASLTLPLVFWGPNVIPEKEIGTKSDWFGSHTDLMPSLINLLTDKPVSFSAFGRPLWDKDKNFYCFNASGDSKYIYLAEERELYEYKTRKRVQNYAKELELGRWWAGITSIAHACIFGNNDWSES